MGPAISAGAICPGAVPLTITFATYSESLCPLPLLCNAQFGASPAERKKSTKPCPIFLETRHGGAHIFAL
jgi:hypothetical protein